LEQGVSGSNVRKHTMFRTLHGKLSAVLLGLLALLGLFYISLTLYTTRKYIEEVDQKLNRKLASDLASEKILFKNGHVHQPALKEVIDMLMVINPNIEVYLLDPQGHILAYSAPSGKVKRQQVSLEPIQRFLNGTNNLPILGDDPSNLNGQKVFSVSPVPAAPGSGPLTGYVYVILSGREYDSVAQMLQGSYILRLGLWMIAASLLFVLLTGPLLFHILTRRLRRLTTAVENFEKAGFQAPATFLPASSPYTQDEIDRLGSVFSHMAARIQQQVQELRDADAQRREMVSNVSHDLRTPLAALQGYLETLLIKEGELTPAQQREYLSIAIRHSERLGSLVAQLFELAKLDSQEVQVHSEPFSLAELVQDIVQKYQLVAEKQQVHLQTQLRADLPFVTADIALLERALENLIENALRHTDAGGVVAVLAEPDTTTVTVQVKDTGHGIATEDLPRIFERFYQVAKHRSDKADGAGLGLAITKRILELHHTDIQVESVLNSGTTFSFTLPIYRATPVIEK